MPLWSEVQLELALWLVGSNACRAFLVLDWSCSGLIMCRQIWALDGPYGPGFPAEP